MKKTILATLAVAGVAGAFYAPNVVSGNARRTEGTLSAMQAAEQPFIAQLAGANEVPGPGDTDGAGAATISFDVIDGTDTEVCWDLTYSGIATATMAHIHTGAAGVAGGIVVDFQEFGKAPGATSFSGCDVYPTTSVQPIIDEPGAFYVNVHNADFPAGAIRGQLAAGPEAAGSAHFLTVPLRAYDSRIAPATKMAAGETRVVALGTGKDSANSTAIAVPPGATAAIVTVTATETGGPGYLTVYSAAITTPATSNVNFFDVGATVGVNTQVAVDAAGQIKITAGPAATHVLVDVVGYLY